MQIRETMVDLSAGIIGGLVATKVNDYVEKAFWNVTPESEKAREPDIGHDSSAEAAAHLLLSRETDEPREQDVEVLKKGVHYGLGAAWGPLYCWLRRHADMTPAVAGIVSGTALSLIVDETLNPVLGITPPPDAYPESAHLRGLLTHVAWGLVCGATAETLRRRWR